MTRKQTLIKALVWRITIAIPLGILFTYLYFGELYKSIQFMLFMNIFFTFCIMPMIAFGSRASFVMVTDPKNESPL